MNERKPELTESFFLIIAIILFFYTQCYFLFDVPGPHFDEAWQGLYANRIATENDFWPLHAMNTYTLSIVHYALAVFYKIFGASFENARIFFVILNSITSTLLCALVYFKFRSIKTTAFFLSLWSLLPIHVFSHRFMIEVTGWHPLCASLALWGAALWRSKPRVSFVLVSTGLILGIYSHIVFLAFAFGCFFAFSVVSPETIKEARVRRLISVVAGFTTPFAVSAYVSTHKLTALAIVLALFVFLISSLNEKAISKLVNICRFAAKFTKWIALFFTLTFLALHYSGVWPMYQHTGPFTSSLLLLGSAIVSIGMVAAFYSLWPKYFNAITWNLFLWVLFFTCIFIMKWSPRFFAVPALLFTLHLTLLCNQISNARIAQYAIAVFLIFYSVFFHFAYIKQHQLLGGSDEDVYFLAMRDSSRDFRPFHRALHWAETQGCLHTLTWVEDDRFGLPISFLKLKTRPTNDKPCPWRQNELFFSHIPNYSQIANALPTKENMPTPVPDITLLEHRKEWGDLAFWLRKKQD